MAPLNAQIEQVRGTLAELVCEMDAVEAELETFSADWLRFDALRDACNVLDRLDELEAGQLFWGELPEIKDPAGHVARLRSRIARFDGEIRGTMEKKANLKAQVNQLLEELDYLDNEIHNAHARDERREDEFAIERELSPVPHQSLMPWSDDDESDRRYRRALLTALLLSLLLGTVIHLVSVPKPVRPAVAQIPERLAMMVRKEPKKPEPVKKAKGEKKEEKKAEKTQTAKAQEKPTQERPEAAPAEQAAAPKKPANTGVLAFKEAFKDLIDETPVAKLGTEARLINTANQTGQALASRSLVAMQGGEGPAGGSAMPQSVAMPAAAGSAIPRSVVVLAAAGATMLDLAAGALVLRKSRVRSRAREAKGTRPSRLPPEGVRAGPTKRFRFCSIVTRLRSTVSIIPNCVRIRPFAGRWCCGSRSNRAGRSLPARWSLAT